VDGGAWRRGADHHDARGRCYGERHREERLEEQRDGVVASVVAARRAFDALSALPEVDAGRLGLVGWSSGRSWWWPRTTWSRSLMWGANDVNIGRSGWRESNPRNQLGRLGLYH
jgi:hypothetical protein